MLPFSPSPTSSLSHLYVYKPRFVQSIMSKQMGLFTVLLVVVIFLAIVGMGWKTFSLGVINGFDKAVDVGTPLVKDLTQQATEYIQDPSLIETNLHN
jgi:hypothetical protein